jgi:sucrose phosphorylase
LLSSLYCVRLEASFKIILRATIAEMVRLAHPFPGMWRARRRPAQIANWRLGYVGVGLEGKPGLLTQSEIEALVDTIHVRSNGQSRMATGAAANNLDLYQVNCTYCDALGCRDEEYLIARAIQFFVPGIPQVYYVGLLAGTNDMDLLVWSGVGRDINRHYYTADEIKESLRYPVVQKLIGLIRLRNGHPAFAGQANVELPNNQRLVIAWENGTQWAKLEVDFKRPAALVTHSKIS